MTVSTMKSKHYKQVTLNVSGEIFETYSSTLERFPDTLLGSEQKLKSYLCSETNQYYFNRNRLCFENILSFYQQYGKLTCPQYVDLEVFENECRFFELPQYKIDAMKLDEGVLSNLDNEVNISEQFLSVSARADLWELLENPSSSKGATVYIFVSMCAIVGAITITILESVGSLKSMSRDQDTDPWALAEYSLNCWFLFEFLTRFVCAPSKKIFIHGWLNWIDALAIFPYFIMLIINPEEVGSLDFLRIIRLLRVFRLFKLSKHSKRLKIVAHIIYMSRSDFALLLLCLWLLVVFSASIMYHIENKKDLQNEFSSIPASLWWGIITVTTVGYGDMYPFSIPGQLFAGLLMLIGVLTMSVPVLSIVTKFELFYEKTVAAEKRKEEIEREERQQQNEEQENVVHPGQSREPTTDNRQPSDDVEERSIENDLDSSVSRNDKRLPILKVFAASNSASTYSPPSDSSLNELCYDDNRSEDNRSEENRSEENRSEENRSEERHFEEMNQ